jgi:hypothetical protein
MTCVQTRDPFFQEPGPPLANRHLGDLETSRHRSHALSFGAGQNHSRSLGHLLRRRRSSHPALQSLALSGIQSKFRPHVSHDTQNNPTLNIFQLRNTSYRIGRISGLQLLLYFVALVGSIAALIAILSGSEGLLATAVDRFGILAIGLILLQLIAFMARLDMNLLREEFQLWLDSLRGQRAQ